MREASAISCAQKQHFLICAGDSYFARWFAHQSLTDRLRIGIQMHRTIDAFSDRHPAVLRSKRILSPEYGRLSGVIVERRPTRNTVRMVNATEWAATPALRLMVVTQDNRNGTDEANLVKVKVR